MAASSEPANIEKRQRGPGRPFTPGVSGNPSGLPKEIAPLVAEARKLALTFAPKAITRLADLLDSKDERVVVAAAEGLLDRAGLKPYALEPERVEVSVGVDVDALRAQLAARVAGLVLAREQAPPIALPAECDSPADSQAGALPVRDASQPSPPAARTEGGTA